MDLRDVPAPELDDPLFQPYWEGAAEGKLVLPRCGACRRMNWPPRGACPQCRSTGLVWEEHRHSGRLFTWTVVGRATAPGYDDVPYTVGIVTLDDAPVRLLGVIVDVEPDDLRMDLPLQARFARAGSDPEFTVVQWAPAPGPTTSSTDPGS